MLPALVAAWQQRLQQNLLPRVQPLAAIKLLLLLHVGRPSPHAGAWCAELACLMHLLMGQTDC